ncbi:MAG: transcriptional repressor [Candidatus Lokiarchaeota archaeon]|nr:transcriptional repressor [Candidatus Lokiarchaeota archaeon]
MESKEIIKILRDRGLKVTVQRLATCKYVLARQDHPSADQIYSALKIDYPTISLGTIYKTLSLMKDLHLVQELGFKDGTIRYDPNLNLHINLVCTSCGKIHDYKPENIEVIWKKLLSNLHVKPEGQRVDIYYKCSDCL